MQSSSSSFLAIFDAHPVRALHLRKVEHLPLLAVFAIAPWVKPVAAGHEAIARTGPANARILQVQRESGKPGSEIAVPAGLDLVRDGGHERRRSFGCRAAESWPLWPFHSRSAPL